MLSIEKQTLEEEIYIQGRVLDNIRITRKKHTVKFGFKKLYFSVWFDSGFSIVHYYSSATKSYSDDAFLVKNFFGSYYFPALFRFDKAPYFQQHKSAFDSGDFNSTAPPYPKISLGEGQSQKSQATQIWTQIMGKIMNLCLNQITLAGLELRKNFLSILTSEGSHIESVDLIVWRIFSQNLAKKNLSSLQVLEKIHERVLKKPKYFGIYLSVNKCFYNKKDKDDSHNVACTIMENILRSGCWRIFNQVKCIFEDEPDLSKLERDLMFVNIFKVPNERNVVLFDLSDLTRR